MNRENISEQDIDWIERYLDGELTDEEKNQFQKRLEEDADFAELLRFREQLPGIWVSARRRFLIRQELEKKIVPGKTIPFRISYRFAAAASVILLLGIFVTYQYRVSRQDSFTSQNQVNVTAPENAPYAGDSALPGKFGRSVAIDVSRQPDPALTTRNAICFRWKSSRGETETHIVIRESQSGKLVFIQKTGAGLNFFTLQPGVLKPGHYNWQISPDILSGSFTLHP